MTLREFIYARLQNDVEVAASQLRTAQAMGPCGLYMFPNAHVRMQSATTHKEVVVWLIERRLWDAPRCSRVQTMKALAYQWRTHPDYLPEWNPTA